MSTYTKEEAKMKWCPFARKRDAGAAGVTAVNRSDHGVFTKCIASECMAWRVVTINELSEVVFAGTREGKRGTGYCGLAGRPE